MTATTSTVRSAVGIGAITALSRVVGFVRVLVVAAVLGTTYLGNAFQSANSVSNILFELVAAGALSSVLVPAFVELLDRDQGEAEEVAGGVLAIAVGGLGVLALVGIVAAPWLATVLTIGVPASVATEQRELVAFLLVFFLPQVVLYAAGTIATVILHAKRRFYAVAAAPMANTVVMVLCLALYRSATGGSTDLTMTSGERFLLAVAGTGGVLAFSAVLVGACRATGFHLRPRLARHDPRVKRVLGLAGWGVVLHTSAGVLLAGAVLAGAAVEGGVVAYQVAWVFFLAPYAIFAQPIQTAVLPELAVEANEAGLDRFRTSVRWALERIALPMVPISLLVTVLAASAMRVFSFGEAAEGDGPALLGAALGSLAIGLLAYASFLMLARAFYALGDSRTPGLVALGIAVGGGLAMAGGALVTDGTARIAVLGLAHSGAHTLGAIVLGVLLARRIGGPVATPMLWLMVAVNGVTAMVAWLIGRVLAPSAPSRAEDLLVIAVTAATTAVVVLGVYRLLGLSSRLTVRHAAPTATDALVPDVLASGGPA